VAHELAHVIQRHTMETHGRETVMLFLAGKIIVPRLSGLFFC